MVVEDNIFKISVLVLLAATVAKIFYCNVLYGIMQHVPKDKHQFPAWLTWLFLIPWIGFIFEWIILPFGIPNTFKKAFANNQDAIFSANTLFKLGLAQMILLMFGIFVRFRPYNQIAIVISLLLWAAYWVLIVKFKNTYLKSQSL